MNTQVEIQNIRDPDGVERIRLTVTFLDAIQKTSLDKHILYFQDKYLESIKKCKILLSYIRESKKNAGDALLKWQLSDVFVNFLIEMEASDFVINNFSRSLSRDLGLSVRLIESMIKFRITYPKIENVNSKLNWDRYRETLDVSDKKIRKLLIEKMLSGDIRTRNEIKQFKLKYLKTFQLRKSKRRFKTNSK